MNFEFQFNKIREQLNSRIQEALKGENILSTYFVTDRKDNLSDVVTCSPDQQCPDSPQAVIYDKQNPDNASCTTYTVTSLIKKDGLLQCLVIDASGSESIFPIEILSLEGLYQIYNWLIRHNFILIKPVEPYCCQECGSTNVEIAAWVDPNNDNEFITDQEDYKNSWCNECQNHVLVKPRGELMKNINA